MRILYITPQPPSLRTGGGLHCYANLRALCAFPSATVSYVGPPIQEPLPGVSDLTVLVSRRYRMADKVLAAVNGAASSVLGLYREWKRGSRGEFDVVFVEFTKAGFAVSELAGSARTVCSVHNVEADFMRDGSTGFSRLGARNVGRSERLSVTRADTLLVMHSADLARLQALYGPDRIEERVRIHPVCAVETLEPIPYTARRRQVIIPGSLDQPYNERGILRFLAEGWPRLADLRVELLIAGRNPTRRIVAAARAAGARLVANPPSMPELVRQSLLTLVPDTGGAGMKLRVAEALSLGVPVVGTAAGLLGYGDVSAFGQVTPDVPAMADAVRTIVSDPGMGQRLGAGAREGWRSRYSFSAFAERLHGWMHGWMC